MASALIEATCKSTQKSTLTAASEMGRGSACWTNSWQQPGDNSRPESQSEL